MSFDNNRSRDMNQNGVVGDNYGKSKVKNDNRTTHVHKTYVYADKNHQQLEKLFENEQGKPMDNGAIRTVLKDFADVNMDAVLYIYGADNFYEILDESISC